MKNLTLFVYCKVRAFLADEEGANAIEYAVIAGLIAVALIAVLSPTDSGIVGGLKAFFDGVGTKVGGLARTDVLFQSDFPPVAPFSWRHYFAFMLALCYKAGRSGAGSWLSPASSLPGGLGSRPS